MSHREPDESALNWAHDAQRRDRFLSTLEQRLHRRQRRRLAVAAGALALLVVGIFSWRISTHRNAASREIVASAAILTPATRSLSDGTVVDLKAGSDFSVEFSPAARRVVLKAGVAHFKVAKNAAWPFVVVARGVEVRAVGTAFAVDLGAQAVEVLVTEGRVAVQASPVLAGGPKADAAEPTSILVDAGKRVALSATQPADLAAVSSTEMAERLSWRIPRLEFSDMPLRDVIGLINHHSPVQLQFGDAEAGKVEISGVLRADNVDPLLRMLESYYGISTERSGDAVILRLRHVP